MFYLKARYYLIFFFLALGILLHIQVGWKPALYLYTAASLLALMHLLYGPVWYAFKKMQSGQLQEADKILDKIHKPQWLAPSPRAYYHFMKGIINLKSNKIPEAKNHLPKALKLGLRTPNDNALVALNLAHVYFMEEDFSRTRVYHEKAQSFDPSDLMIKEHLEKLGARIA